MVGHEAFARAMVYARSGHVHDVELDDEALVISGRVKGTYRDDYRVTVHLASSRTGAVTAYRSQCNCPVAQDCKHAAAVLVVARHLAAAAQLVERPEWEKALDKLITGTPAPAGRHRPARVGVRGRAHPGVPRATSAGRICGSVRHDSARPATGSDQGSAGTISTSSPARTCPSTESCCCSSGRRPEPAPGTPCPAVRGCPSARSAAVSGDCSTRPRPTGLTMITAKPLLGPIQAERSGRDRAGCSPDAGRGSSSARG